MCYVCAGGCDAAAEGAAYMSLLQEYVEAAYLLPEDAHLGEGFVERDIEGRKLPADSEMTGCIRLFRHAMLPPQPLHTRLTSCACLLRAWAAETAGPDSASKPFLAWVSQAGVISDIYDCLQAGLRLRFQFGSLYQYPWLARMLGTLVQLPSVTSTPCGTKRPDAARCSKCSASPYWPHAVLLCKLMFADYAISKVALTLKLACICVAVTTHLLSHAIQHNAESENMSKGCTLYSGSHGLGRAHRRAGGLP